MHDRRDELAAAFKTCRFIYGTQGSNVISKVIGRFVSGLEAKQAREKVVEHDPAKSAARLKNVFDPGFRARAYVHGLNAQMMDLYYGQYGTTTFQQRNEFIGEFVHRAMRFSGMYQHDVPGYKAYWNTFGHVKSPNAGSSWHPSPFYEGWETPPADDHPRKRYSGYYYPNPDSTEPFAGMSATKYMSRVIRAGIMYFGGTLVYDGAGGLLRVRLLDATGRARQRHRDGGPCAPALLCGGQRQVAGSVREWHHGLPMVRPGERADPHAVP